MRHRTVIVSGLAALVLGMGGCATTSPGDAASLGAFAEPTTRAIGPLGAGDQYGAMVYTAYLASRLDANELEEAYAVVPTTYAPE